jgi:NAD(P)-dependent dehydrogenase (short-subunit alcohol dehydrogenase family)
MLDFVRECRRGFIINLLDQRISRVEPGAGSYGLAKKSLRDATEAAAVEWAPEIRVNAVAPGIVLPPPGVSPDQLEPLLVNVPMGSTSSCEEVADACLFLASSTTVTGQILYVDGGMHLAATVQPEKTMTGQC